VKVAGNCIIYDIRKQFNILLQLKNTNDVESNNQCENKEDINGVSEN
jgi:hypothetical protein